MFRLLPLAALLLLLPGTAAATADKVRMYEKVSPKRTFWVNGWV